MKSTIKLISDRQAIVNVVGVGLIHFNPNTPIGVNPDQAKDLISRFDFISIAPKKRVEKKKKKKESVSDSVKLASAKVGENNSTSESDEKNKKSNNKNN